MSEKTVHSLSGDPWVGRLLELETEKKDALLAFDAEAYEASAGEQTRLVSAGVPDVRQISPSSARKLAERIRLNSTLLLNLVSISPHFALARQGYTSGGEPAGPRLERVRVEG